MARTQQKQRERRAGLALRLRGLLTSDLSVKVLSLLLAVVIWFAVTGVRSNSGQVVEKVFSVPLRLSGVGEGLAAVGPAQDVEIRIKGPRSVVDSAAGKLAAEVDLTGRGEGTHVLRVSAVFPERATLEEVIPSSVQVRVEALISRTVDVALAVVGPPGSAGPPNLPEASVHAVSVRGPRSLVSTVAWAVCRVSPDPRTGAVGVREVEPVPVDADGRPVTGVTVYPAVVSVGDELTRNVGRE